MHIRLAIPDDALAVAQVHVRAWQAAYRGLLPDDYLDTLRPADRASRYDFTHLDPQKPRTIIAEHEGQITGFATTMPTREAGMPDYGELCALYVDPDKWREGTGAALVNEARDYLAAQGFRHALLWILKRNTRAERFYQFDGWHADGTERSEQMWGITVNEVRYTRRLK